MYESAAKSRIQLLKYMLFELKSAASESEELANKIENLSGHYYKEATCEGKEDVALEIENYNSNMDRIKAINQEITTETNLWYEFTKSKDELSKLTYPFIYFVKKHKLKRYVSERSEEISRITIENRFIKERLTLLEHQLEIAALNKLKNDATYSDYERLESKIEALVKELMYLVPTIPSLCPIIINISVIDELLDKLSNIEAA